MGVCGVLLFPRIRRGIPLELLRFHGIEMYIP